jgi:hypothetical protein
MRFQRIPSSSGFRVKFDAHRLQPALDEADGRGLRPTQPGSNLRKRQPVEKRSVTAPRWSAGSAARAVAIRGFSGFQSRERLRHRSIEATAVFRITRPG